jgi:hypothetical protein
MSTLTLAATDRAPAVEFDFAGNVFALSGESFPIEQPDVWRFGLRSLSHPGFPC